MDVIEYGSSGFLKTSQNATTILSIIVIGS
jgi:hypothetical protein